ncbi:MAG TPA: DUF4293 family protein [Chitinophagaceae bacterium]|nr:DUF4293 family protein [Chitinophagaceae bacterium]
MIQRQQTLWFLLAAAAAVLSFMFPFYTGNIIKDGTTIPSYHELDGASGFFLLVLTGITAVIAIAAIFLYKERKTQLKVAVAGAVVSIILLIIYISQVKKFANGRLSLSSVLVIAVIIGFVLAARGIWRDEKLVKSLDKLR